MIKKEVSNGEQSLTKIVTFGMSFALSFDGFLGRVEKFYHGE
jgi:hypothetical protein